MQNILNYRKGLIAVILLLTIFLYGCTQAGITGQAVREQQQPVQQIVTPTIDEQESQLEVASGACQDGFGFERKNPDGSVYCWDPCNGNQDCIATFDNVEEVDFVSAGSNSQESTQQGNLQASVQDSSTSSSSQDSSDSGSESSSGSGNKRQI